MKEELAMSQCEKSENQAEQNKSHAVATLKPTQHRHIVVSFVMTGAIWLMLICSAGSRGVSNGPQNV
jgi:hypothetical protein